MFGKEAELNVKCVRELIKALPSGKYSPKVYF
jgi:hypothetical protein